MGKFLIVLLAIITLFTVGCLGGLHVRETQYFSVQSYNGHEINYYRLNVKANTMLSKAEYHSGWYPRESIDQLFGEVTAESSTDYIATQRKLKELLNKKIIEVDSLWLEKASDPANSDASLQSLHATRARILAYPSLEMLDSPYLTASDAIVMEYNPGLERAIRHIDQKQVFFLSSNPDEIITEIQGFVESQETALQLKKIAETIESVQKGQLASKLTSLTLDSISYNMVISQLDSAINRLNNDNISPAILQSTIQDLQSIILR